MVNEFDESKYPGKIEPFHHGTLDLEGKLNKETGRIRMKDKKDPAIQVGNNQWIEYSGKEVEILKKSCGVDKNVHMIKKIFGGEVVEK